MKPLIYPYSILRIIPSFRCNFNCSYCSCEKYQENLCHTSLYVKEEFDSKVWIERLDTLEPQRAPLLVMFCAGEPTLYKDFSQIINSLNRENVITFIYTNLSIIKEIRRMKPHSNLWFDVSYHPLGMTKERFIKNAIELKSRFQVLDFHGVPHPDQKDILEEDALAMAKEGIRLTLDHPYLFTKKNEYQFYGNLGNLPKFRNRFASRVEGVPEKQVCCKTSFNHHTAGRSGLCYPIAPNGDVYTCWRYLLNHSNEGILGNFFDPDFEFVDEYFKCDHYGDCNACAWDKNIIDKRTGRQLDTDVVAWESLI